MKAASAHRPAGSFELGFGARGELRHKVGETGRVHMDRWLPFLVLNRSANPSSSIARRVAIDSPAYLIWSPGDEAEAAAALDAVSEALGERFARLLLIEVRDAPFDPPKPHSPSLAQFLVRIGQSGGDAARDAAAALADAARAIEVDGRVAEVDRSGIDEPLLACTDSDRVTLTIPQIHRAPDGNSYPQLTHCLATACSDAILRAACAFMDAAKLNPPTHHRALGRSAFLAAAHDADRKLDRVARSFDLLLAVTPINTAEARERFFAQGEQKSPCFHYRPLPIDPDSAKRDLYLIDLSILEDSLLERLLSEKRRELDQMLTMLSARNTPGMRAASQFHYGSIDESLMADARAILDGGQPPPEQDDRVGAEQMALQARSLIAKYRDVDQRFAGKAEVRGDVGGMLVSEGKLLIAASSTVARKRVDPLLAHEVSVHMLTYYNGSAQGLSIFRSGLAHYEIVQEGLGVFAEWAVGGLTRARVRLIAARVLAVDAMLDGAEFVEVYRTLKDEFGLLPGNSFDVTARVYRSGGFAKDFIYLKGFRQVADRVREGGSLDPLWLGKIALEHIPAIEELVERGLLREAVFRPEFLDREDVQARIGRLRSGLRFDQMLGLE